MYIYIFRYIYTHTNARKFFLKTVECLKLLEKFTAPDKRLGIFRSYLQYFFFRGQPANH